MPHEAARFGAAAASLAVGGVGAEAHPHAGAVEERHASLSGGASL